LRSQNAAIRKSLVGKSAKTFAWSPDGKAWAVGTESAIYVQRGETIFKCDGGASALCFDHSGQRVFSAIAKGQIRSWAFQSDRVDDFAVECGVDERLSSIAYVGSENAQCLVGTDLGRIRLFGVSGARKSDWSTVHDGAVTQLALSSDCSQAYCAGRDGYVVAVGLPKLDVRNRVRLHDDWINDVSVSPDGQFLAGASHDNSIVVWNLLTWSRAAVLGEHNGVVRAVTFSSDGRFLASGGDDARVNVWKLGQSK
jgi:WD40 repeat protein